MFPVEECKIISPADIPRPIPHRRIWNCCSVDELASFLSEPGPYIPGDRGICWSEQLRDASMLANLQSNAWIMGWFARFRNDWWIKFSASILMSTLSLVICAMLYGLSMKQSIMTSDLDANYPNGWHPIVPLVQAFASFRVVWPW